MTPGSADADVVAGELAAGRDPAILLWGLDRARARSLEAWAEAYALSRVDAAPRTVASIRVAAKAFPWRDRDPSQITPVDVAEWLAGFPRRETARRYLQVLRQVFDYSATDPNPAKDARVRLPREERVEVEPPSARDVDLIIANCTEGHRLAVLTLAETGMRVGELVALRSRVVVVCTRCAHEAAEHAGNGLVMRCAGYKRGIRRPLVRA